MKLILLLAAIYSLIFYQQYKIEKDNTSVPRSKGSFKMDGSYKHFDLPDKNGNGNADMVMRSYYSVYRYSNSGGPKITAFHYNE